MKWIVLGFAAIAALGLAGVLLWNSPRPSPPEPALDWAPLDPGNSRRVAPIEVPASELNRELLSQMQLLTNRMLALEDSVGELKRGLELYQSTETRMPVARIRGDLPTNLPNEDLDAIGGRLRQALYDEAWLARQERYVDFSQELSRQFQLRKETLLPLIEVVCRYEKKQFQMERNFAEADHRAATALLAVDENRRARVFLRQELLRLFDASELVARLFVHIVSRGKLSTSGMSKTQVFSLEQTLLE